jgi:hypothetical protein
MMIPVLPVRPSPLSQHRLRRFLAIGPLATRPTATGGDAWFVGIEELLDRADVSGAKMQCLENGARTRAGLHEAVDDEKAPRRLVGVLLRRQAGVGQMDIGEAIIALAPGFRGARDITDNRRRYRLAIRSGQQRQQPRFLASQALQSAGSVRRNHYRARSQQQTLGC